MARVAIPFFFVLALAADGRAESPDEFFEARVRPLLAEKCHKCHAGTKSRGGLRLDSRAAVLTGGDSGPAAIPGDPGKSLLLAAVRHSGELKMPPDRKLTDREVADLETWIRLKLPWPNDQSRVNAANADLWSLKPVVDPSLPKVADARWPIRPLDRFILARLESKGLKPAAAADRRTLARRVAFDLTGLPPTPDEVDAFVNDSSPDAYEKLIDRLLASPAYGQRWGRHWLDLVRYCDSFDGRIVGNEMDCADAWRYRDWVVSAINRDVPYDKFVRMQVAGDVIDLPDAEHLDGLVATGMLALGNWGGGDADKEKLLTDIVDDQIDVIGRSVLGLTLACARCHDHKFDPLTTTDYYGLAGIFFSTHILPNVGPKTNGPPMLRIPLETPADVSKRSATEAKLKAAEKALAETTAKARASVLAKLKVELPRHLLAAHEGRVGEDLDPRWLKLAANPTRLPAGTVLARPVAELFGKPGLRGWRGPTDPPSFVVNATGSEAKFLTITMPPKSVAVHPGPGSDVAVVWTSPSAGEIEARGTAADFDPNCGDGFTWELRHAAAAGGDRNLAGGTTDNGQKDAFAAKTRVAAGDRLVLVIRRRAEYSCDTTGVEFVVRGEASADLAADWLAAPAPATAKLGPWSVEELGSTRLLSPKVVEAAAQWEKARLTGNDVDGAARRFADAVVSAGGLPFVPPDADEFYTAAARADLDRLRRDIAGLKKELSAPRSFTNGAQEGGVPGSPHAGTHDVRVHVRGRYDRLGDLVPRRFPDVIRVASPPVISSGSGRKELADWLTRPDHPLTARVIVNRIWQYHFGDGLVRTPSNFGVLGEPPTHPELLDHLARKFVADGWSLKKLHRYILTSATYRQSAAADPTTRAADPDNKLWGRFSRRRLEAEAVRDSLLAIAGKLDATSGGPAVRDFNSPRRTLYLMSIRSDRTGFGPLFDVADSTAPVDKRTVSTVAPQALFLMNHPFVQDQTKAFVGRVLERDGSDDERLVFAHRLAFGRPPTDEELALGREFLRTIGGSRTAWESWCHLLTQANEFVVIE